MESRLVVRTNVVSSTLATCMRVVVSKHRFDSCLSHKEVNGGFQRKTFTSFGFLSQAMRSEFVLFRTILVL